MGSNFQEWFIMLHQNARLAIALRARQALAIGSVAAVGRREQHYIYCVREETLRIGAAAAVSTICLGRLAASAA